MDGWINGWTDRYQSTMNIHYSSHILLIDAKVAINLADFGHERTFGIPVAHIPIRYHSLSLSH